MTTGAESAERDRSVGRGRTGSVDSERIERGRRENERDREENRVCLRSGPVMSSVSYNYRHNDNRAC